MEEKETVYNIAKTLLEVSQALEPIDRRLSEMTLFVSERTLSLGEERGYHLQGGDACECTDECQDVKLVGDQMPANCVGHSNNPQAKPMTPDVQSEVKSLVDKIRSESSNAR